MYQICCYPGIDGTKHSLGQFEKSVIRSCTQPDHRDPVCVKGTAVVKFAEAACLNFDTGPARPLTHGLTKMAPASDSLNKIAFLESPTMMR